MLGDERTTGSARQGRPGSAVSVRGAWGPTGLGVGGCAGSGAGSSFLSGVGPPSCHLGISRRTDDLRRLADGVDHPEVPGLDLSVRHDVVKGGVVPDRANHPEDREVGLKAAAAREHRQDSIEPNHQANAKKIPGVKTKPTPD